MTAKKNSYPSTPSQQATALRRGWTYDKKTGKGWRPPENFSEADQLRIDIAARRRSRRRIKAD